MCWKNVADKKSVGSSFKIFLKNEVERRWQFLKKSFRWNFFECVNRPKIVFYIKNITNLVVKSPIY